MNARFEHVAAVITERVAELLGAPVFVINNQGVIVTSSEPGQIGFKLGANGVWMVEHFRVPLHFNGQRGEVVVHRPHSGEEISPRLAQVLVELVINQTAVVDRLPNQHELKNKLIYDLLHGQIDDEATIIRQARILGMDLTPPRAVILIDAASYILAPSISGQSGASDARIRRRAQLVIGSVVNFFQLPNDTICAYIGEGEVAVLKASNTKNLVSWAGSDDGTDQINSSWANLSALKRAGEALLTRLHSDTGASMNVGIGRYHPGIQGLSRSYQDARVALSLGRHFHGQNRVHCLHGLGIAAFIGLADERTKVDLATYLLSPLDHEPELIQTLEHFFAEDCCPSSTAARLSIHRNTLSYRLDKITSLTGLDPRSFDDAVQIRLALLLRSLRSRVG